MSDETNVSLIKFGTVKAEDVAKHIAETKSTIDNINKLLAHTVAAVQQLQAASQEQNKNNEAVNNAFKSLQDGVKGLTTGIRDVRQTINDSNDSGDKRSGEEQVRQKNAEKTQRAVQNALFGEVKKNRTALNVLQDTLKNCFNKTLDILKDGFKKSLQAYDELSSSLRKQNLSTELKNQAHLLSDLANKGSFAVSKQTTNAVTEYLAANDTALFKKFTDVNATDEQKKLYGEIVNVGALLKEGGLSEDKITTLMAGVNASNIEEFRKIAVQSKASGSEGEAARLAIDKLLSTPGGLASLGTNGFEKLNTSLLAVRELASTGAANAELSSGLVELATKIENGKLYDVDEQTLMKALAISGNNINNPKELTDSINKKLLDINAAANSGNTALATKMAEDLKRSIEPLSQELPDFVIGMQNAANRAASGNLNTGGAEKFEEIEKNIETNRQDGLIGDVLGNITSSINLFTAKLGFDGGALGSLSTFLDETTNGQLTVEEVVSSGFNAVTDLLKTINLQLLTQSVGNFFTNGPGRGVFDKFIGKLATKFPILSKLGFGAAGATGVTGVTSAAGAAGTGVSKFAPLLKGLKAIGIAGTVVSVGIAGKEMYDAFTEDRSSYITDESSQAYKNIEKDLNKKATVAKAAGATVKAGLSIGAAAAGAKIGAMIGTAAGPIGTAIGAAVGVAAGAAIGPIVSGIADVEMDKLVASLDDTKAKQKQISDILANGGLTPEAEKHYREVLSKLEGIEKNTKESMVNDVLSNFEEQNEELKENNTGGTIAKLNNHLNNLNTELAIAQDNLAKNPSAAAYENEHIKQLEESIKNTRTAIQYTLGEKTGMENGQSIESYINDKKEGIFGGDSIKWSKYRNQSDNKYVGKVNGSATLLDDNNEYNKNIWNKIIDDLHNGLFGNDTVNKLAQIKDADVFKSAFIEILNKTGFSADKEFANYALQQMIKELGKSNEEGFKELTLLANGGIINKATPAIVGEDGKEAVLPLTKPGALSKVLQDLDKSDKLQLLKLLLAQPSFTTLGLISALTSLFKVNTNKEQNNSLPIPDIANGVPGNDRATIEKILSYAGADRDLVYDLIVNGRTKKYGFGLKKREEWFKEALTNAANQEGRDLIRGTYAERALEYGVSEIGKPYILRSLGKIGYVCNELVNAAVKASGFDMNKFMVHGVKATFANIKKGKYSDKNKYPDFRLRPDLTPQTALPGMVFFQDSRKNKEGGFQPGHIGLVYYGHQKLHSSGGSSDYTKTGFLRNWQTPCRGVTVTPFDNNSYVIGEFPGLFEQASGEWKPPVNSPVPFGPGIEGEVNKDTQIKSVKDTGLMTSEEITDLLVKQTGVNAAAAAQYVSQAMSLIDGKSQGEVLAVLIEIAKYIKGIALTGANKGQIMSAVRPPMSVYQ